MADDDYDALLHPRLDGLRTDTDGRELPLYVTAGLGGIAAVLVAFATVTAIGSGYPAIGFSLLAAVALFFASLVSLELGRWLGART